VYCTEGLYTPAAGGPRNASSSAPRAAANAASYAAGAVYLARAGRLCCKQPPRAMPRALCASVRSCEACACSCACSLTCVVQQGLRAACHERAAARHIAGAKECACLLTSDAPQSLSMARCRQRLPCSRPRRELPRPGPPPPIAGPRPRTRAPPGGSHRSGHDALARVWQQREAVVQEARVAGLRRLQQPQAPHACRRRMRYLRPCTAALGAESKRHARQVTCQGTGARLHETCLLSHRLDKHRRSGVSSRLVLRSITQLGRAAGRTAAIPLVLHLRQPWSAPPRLH